MDVFFKLAWFFKAQKKYYILGLIMLLFIALLELLPPQIIGKTIDGITKKTLTPQLLTIYLIILAVAAVLIYISRYIWRISIFGTSQKLGNILRRYLYHKYTEMSAQFFQKRRTGDLMAHATNDINAVQNAAGAGILMIADSLITGGMVIITMAITISWQLTLIVLIPLPIMVLLTRYYGRLLSKGFKKAQAAFSRLNDKTQESVAGIKVTKTFGYEQEDQADFRNLSDDVVKKNLTVAKVDSLFDPTIMLVFGTSEFLAIAFGAHMVFAQTITLGQLITFSTYLGMLVWPLLALGLFFNIVQRAKASYERIDNILNTPNAIDTSYTLDDLPQGNIQFNIPTFHYPGYESRGLKDVYFTIESGTTVGVVGRTGSGKSTLIKLLLREFDTLRPEDITYNGKPISSYSRSALRTQFGYVPQEHFLFSTTIRNNIAFGNIEVQDQQLYHVSKMSHIHDDISAFPQGYDTVVGERGVSLSGGQKQRISIARALLLDPEVLILDDSLSAVDAQTEEAILTNLQTLRSKKTNIITAHRMSAVKDADLILVMDQGTIVERGTHTQLMDNKGWYYDTYTAQALQSKYSQNLDDLTKGDGQDE
ncbi:ABC transporter ATP-binding protein [Staphylococcus kloosii]|jgi:ATP-binding cassette subfamily B multidrug efflux pump|uniref:ATP-binding cassette domain-containing protein n=1 Tax=Staphylococcus kloosii TaxID=29384 RepID=A0A921GXN0_9STAP|nr:ABC transporter transmembrane domain-containing protein [Staphylococcus kloosii]AVQ35288.1 multidrug ABC transporter permease/ATP-binding protein [Staphylococcus kloosii]MBF7021224.1 ATP-binding cassette domain-containing protein [Staphylococcus kloosii]MBF7030500.1 ATP-binding cassette domain-containing protein [Staphylococcus kloosii]MCD8879758.1 ATP-binding cassette domain-containing protein [Staphylococcus kloosii]PNZ04533.1 multidrug ABC transporter permease/ATP-binding protein [Staphy